MGVEALTRQNTYMSPGISAPGSAEGAVMRTASPYALSMTDAAGHIRKFEEMEAEIIKTSIARYEGHMSEVARRLGIGRSTLYRKLKEFGLEPENAVEAPEADSAIEDAIRKAS
jgi:DNA-binding NtrC family response regulator